MDELFRQIGRYVVVARIGSGGFATVYRARDSNLDREVAVKVMRPLLLSDAAFVERFRQEALTVANLDHPHIVPIYDYGDIEDRLCLVMKLLPGGSLADLIAHGPLPWGYVVQLAGQIGAALDYAHGRGLVHRDIKPENVLVDVEGNAVLGDFGLVRALESGRLTTSLSGGVLGTPAYLAPEVWNGLPGTPQTDVYSMACLIFEMVTGTQLFNAPTPPATMMLHFHPPQFPSRWPAGVPPGIDRVLRRALARAPEDRYRSAGQLAAELARLEDDPLAERYAALEAAVAAEEWDDAIALGERIVDEAPGYREARALLDRASEARIAVQHVAWAAQWREATERALSEGDGEGALLAAQRWQQLAPDDAAADTAVAAAAAAVAEEAKVIGQVEAAETSSIRQPAPAVERVTFTAPAGEEGAAPGAGASASVAQSAGPRRPAWPGWARVFRARSDTPQAEDERVGERRFRPVITYGLLVIMVISFLSWILPYGNLYAGWGDYWQFKDFLYGEPWRLLTTLFFNDHLTSLLLSGYVLYVAGTEVEARYGHGRFALIFFGTGLMMNALSLLNIDIAPAAAARGGVYGALGALAAYLFIERRRRDLEDPAVGATTRRLYTALILFFFAFVLAIPWHFSVFRLAGFVAGFALGYLLAPRPRADRSDAGSLRRRWWVVVALAAVVVTAIVVAFT